jgi:GMP synthase PP-ATPase subunit
MFLRGAPNNGRHVSQKSAVEKRGDAAVWMHFRMEVLDLTTKPPGTIEWE